MSAIAVIAVSIALIMLFVLLANGLWIHSVLIAVGFIGTILMGQGDVLYALFGRMPVKEIQVYSLSTIPLFVLMAQFFMQAGIIEDLFAIVFNMSKGARGPMGVLLLIVGAFLGAVSGSGVATAAALGQICVPELKKYGYSDALAGAVTASAGSLSGIIPPTVILILYGTMTETPISTLFVAAVIPGTILTACYIACNLVYVSIERSQEKKYSGQSGDVKFERIPITLTRTVIASAISITVALVVFIGIYSGFFTPTEAAAIGSLAVFIAALFLKKVNKMYLWKCMSETAKVSAMVMLIIVSAKVFARFVSLSGVTRALIASLQPLLGMPVLVLILLIFFYFVCFCFLEGSAVIVMTVPILLPLIQAMDVGVVWFGVFVCIAAVVGQLTPPVGMAVYAVCGIAKLDMGSVFKRAIVFAMVGATVTGVLVILFPQLVTWLPSLMG